jgi:DNA-binding transcriptional LysR family regulator
MNLSQLEYFVAVAEEGGFTNAARRVHISQSGVSAQIRRLERELGTELFDRTGRDVALTSGGRAALGPARATLAAAASVRAAVDEVTGLLRGEVRVGMVVGCTVAPLFDALDHFHRQHPRIEISLSEARSDVLLEQVRTGEVDLALAGVAGEGPPDLAHRVVVEDRLVAIVAPDHPLHGRSRVGLEQLLEHPLVCMPAQTGIRAALDRSAAVKGLRARVAVEASAPDAVVALAGRGLGVGVLSASMVERGGPVHPVAVTGAEVAALLVLVWRSGPGAAVGELVRSAEQAFFPRA